MIKEELYYKPDSKTLREEPQVFTRWQDPTIEQLQQENKQLKEDYQFELEENSKLSELWCKSRQENKQLKEENARLLSQNKDLEDKILWQEEHI